MCGINGFTFKDKQLIDRMNSATKHRGPDGVGTFFDDRISIGHNLLAIADTPEHSQQPVISDDAVLAYNGEVYNYTKLRTGLGGIFQSDSDTEVVFAGLARHGVDFLSRLDGMYAIAWYDRRRQKLFLARDPVGMKPMYYTTHKGAFLFSSELRGLLEHDISRKLNHAMTPVFFALGYVPGSETLIRGIYKVMPGQIIEYDLATKKISEHWIAMDDRDGREGDVKSAIARSVKSHTMGLRPFGLYLSGGLDSSIVLHELSQISPDTIKTYTTRFQAIDPRFNEDADLAHRLCKEYRVDHHELMVTEQNFVDAIEPSISAMEEPRYNHSVPAYWLLAREASKEVTVILNGSGGDELFMGYGRYDVSRKISSRLLQPWWRLGYAFKGITDPLSQWAYVHALSRGRSSGVVPYLRGLHHPRLDHPLEDRENAVAEYDRLFWLADEEFLRTDKIAMHFGMEGRFPLLAREIRMLANSISAEHKGSSKGLLRDAYRGKLPDYIVEKPKTGWNAPVTEWMQGKFGDIVRDVMGKDFVPQSSYTLKDMKSILPMFSFKIWMRLMKITS